MILEDGLKLELLNSKLAASFDSTTCFWVNSQK